MSDRGPDGGKEKAESGRRRMFLTLRLSTLNSSPLTTYHSPLTTHHSPQLMNFALLGGETTVLPLVRAIAADPRHRLRTAALIPAVQGTSAGPGMLNELLSLAPGVRIESQWEGLPHDADVDAVIAVVGSAEVDECVKQTAAAGKPVLLLPKGDPASALVYELTLVRDDTRVPLVPCFPLRFCGAFRRWPTWCEPTRSRL